MEYRSRLPGEPSLDHPGVPTGRLGHRAGLKTVGGIFRRFFCGLPALEASRRAEPEPASGRASKLWLPTARVVDIGYCGYSEPFGGAGEGHTGLRLGLASPYLRIRR